MEIPAGLGDKNGNGGGLNKRMDERTLFFKNLIFGTADPSYFLECE